ncbi:hypothetical protein GCM10010176_106580 [Nonomuraea spiralis]|nr:hypothetical protein GCM10010176_106580 [Nonomuraea spiralis]
MEKGKLRRIVRIRWQSGGTGSDPTPRRPSGRTAGAARPGIDPTGPRSPTGLSGGALICRTELSGQALEPDQRRRQAAAGLDDLTSGLRRTQRSILRTLADAPPIA